ncbi:hypothetical protein [Actinomadura gamaensis]|uniref:Tetratricopeptide repeat protein n=1 Tax=Actinomadura gamaensis TaxID=1763541 RepID=A0ABV9UBM6_9ACTN
MTDQIIEDRAEEIGFNNPIIDPGLGDLAEAHIRLGDLDGADRALCRLEDQASATGLVWPVAAAARCRGLLSRDLTAAERCFAEAEAALRRWKMPFEQARVRLSRGKVLRRHQHGAEARSPLRKAWNLLTPQELQVA